MKQIRTWQKYVAGALLMGTATVLFSLSSVLPVEAADATSGASTMPPQRQEDPMAGRVNPIDHNIDTLVQEGKITQDQATKLKRHVRISRRKNKKITKPSKRASPLKRELMKVRSRKFLNGLKDGAITEIHRPN